MVGIEVFVMYSGKSQMGGFFLVLELAQGGSVVNGNNLSSYNICVYLSFSLGLAYLSKLRKSLCLIKFFVF